MNRMTAVLGGDDDEAVRSATLALATLLGLEVQWFRAPHHGDPDRLASMLAALEHDSVEIGTIGLDTSDDGFWDVLPRVTRPLLVVPANAASPSTRPPGRVLVPLDGSAVTAASVTEIADRLRAAGEEVVAVHVFVPTTVPAFWDQAAHSHASWSREFLRRNLPAAGALELRRGRPVDEILAEIAETAVDLLLLGWSQDLDGDHGEIVRRALTAGSVPVLLVPARVPSPTAEPLLARPGTFGTLGAPGRGRRM